MSDDTKKDGVNLGGWGWPGLSKKAHYFAPGSGISLCGKWMFLGKREDAESAGGGPDDCRACVRKQEKRILGRAPGKETKTP